MAAPIKLTIYNDEHEAVKELQTSLVPWGILKRAIKLAKTFKADGSNPTEMMASLDDESFDNLTGLVADLFHGKVTVEELTWGADAGEMAAVMQAIVTRAFGEFGNAGVNPASVGDRVDPTRPGQG